MVYIYSHKKLRYFQYYYFVMGDILEARKHLSDPGGWSIIRAYDKNKNIIDAVSDFKEWLTVLEFGNINGEKDG